MALDEMAASRSRQGRNPTSWVEVKRERILKLNVSVEHRNRNHFL